MIGLDPEERKEIDIAKWWDKWLRWKKGVA